MRVFTEDKDQNLLFVGPGIFRVYGATLTVAAESANDVDVTFQLTDLLGTPLKQYGVLIMFWVTADTAGNFATGTALTTLTCATAEQVAKIITTGALVAAYTDVNGLIVMRGTIAGAATRRLVAALPGASLVQSGTMTWT